MPERLPKLELIKKLARARVQEIPWLGSFGSIDNLTELELLGLPEATVVCIVETFAVLKTHGKRDEEALLAIEEHRASFGDFGPLPRPLTLESYVKYRVQLEHSHGLGLTDDSLSTVIKTSLTNFD